MKNIYNKHNNYVTILKRSYFKTNINKCLKSSTQLFVIQKQTYSILILKHFCFAVYYNGKKPSRIEETHGTTCTQRCYYI